MSALPHPGGEGAPGRRGANLGPLQPARGESGQEPVRGGGPPCVAGRCFCFGRRGVVGAVESGGRLCGWEESGEIKERGGCLRWVEGEC